MTEAKAEPRPRSTHVGHDTRGIGSSGVGYLKTALERSFFPELWEVRIPF